MPLNPLESSKDKSHQADGSWPVEFDKLASEANLVTGAVKMAPRALAEKVQTAAEHKGTIGLEIAGSVAVGAAFALATKHPEMLGKTMTPYLEGMVQHTGKLLGTAATVDTSFKLAAPAYGVWKDPLSLAKNQKILGESLGATAFDYTVMAAGGLSGYALGSRLSRSTAFSPGRGLPKERAGEKGLQETLTLEGKTLESKTFAALSEQMKLSNASGESVVASVRPENLLGRGSNGAVYKLDFTDNFVVKVPEFNTATPRLGALEKVEDILPEGNIGQAVAKMGDFEILKKQEGFAAGAPLYRARKAMGPEQAEAIYAHSINTSAAMPQQAFDDLATTLMAVEKRGLSFDPSKPGNILIDPVAQRFNLVDVARTKDNTHKVSVSDMICTLMDNYFTGSVLPDKGLSYRPQLQSIIEKANLAARKANMPDIPSSSLDYSYKLAGLEKPS